MTAEVPAIRRLAGKNYPPGGHFCRAYGWAEAFPEEACRGCRWLNLAERTNRALGNMGSELTADDLRPEAEARLRVDLSE